MIRQIVIGLVAGLTAIAAMMLIKHTRPPTVVLGPQVIRMDDMQNSTYAPLFATWRPTTTPVGSSAAMNQPVEQVEFKEMPFFEFVKWIRRQTGTNVIVDWSAIRSDTFHWNTPVTLSATKMTPLDILSIVLSETGGKGLCWYVDDGVIYITSEEDMQSKVRVTRVYNVRDLMVDVMRFSLDYPTTTQPKVPTTLPVLPPSPAVNVPRNWYPGRNLNPRAGSKRPSAEEMAASVLIEMVCTVVNADNWPEPAVDLKVSYWAGKLIVTQSPRAHARIEALLAELRRKDR